MAIPSGRLWVRIAAPLDIRVSVVRALRHRHHQRAQVQGLEADLRLRRLRLLRQRGLRALRGPSSWVCRRRRRRSLRIDRSGTRPESLQVPG